MSDMRTNSIRPPAVAGSWYPGTPGALGRDVDRYLEAAAIDVPRGRLDAIVAPHAGLMFSGPVGAYAYKAAAACGPYDAAILVGPSHFGAFDSPLGAARIDEGLAREIAAASPVVHALPEAHRREHSLEMQLPFIRRLLPDVPIVPMLMGFQTRETIEALATALARAGAGRRVLLVASTDLSHYFEAAKARELDARVEACVAAADPDRLLDVFERYPEAERGRFVACGGGPAIAVMMAARARGARHGRVLKYMHSGEVSGDNTAVVGYLAGALGMFTDVH
jgi:AmmeMemoRadiSam system protein B